MGRGMNVGEWLLATLKEHPGKIVFSPSETAPLIPTIPIQNNPTPTPRPLPKGFSVWDHPISSLVERKGPSKESHSGVCSPLRE